MNIDDFEIGSPHALALAHCLDGEEEATLGPSDIELCVKALRKHSHARRTRPLRKISANEPITIEANRSRDRGKEVDRVHLGSRAPSL